jgi:hypothetical protein
VHELIPTFFCKIDLLLGATGHSMRNVEAGAEGHTFGTPRVLFSSVNL